MDRPDLGVPGRRLLRSSSARRCFWPPWVHCNSELARRRINPPWLKYFWAIFDCALLTPRDHGAQSLRGRGPPPSTILRRKSLILLYLVFLVQAAFTFSPRLVGWLRLCIIAGWTVVLFWVMGKPGVFFDLGLPDRSGIRAYAARYANPFYFPLSKWLIEVFAVALLTFGLAIAVARSRRLVAQATHAERARSNLARHFSPNMVETLSLSDQPFDRVRRQNAAVLFADIRDFARFAEGANPDDVVDLLRAFHALLQNEVFEAQGTLDKVMGDGLMATFGVPVSAQPTRPRRCAAPAACCAPSSNGTPSARRSGSIRSASASAFTTVRSSPVMSAANNAWRSRLSATRSTPPAACRACPRTRRAPRDLGRGHRGGRRAKWATQRPASPRASRPMAT